MALNSLPLPHCQGCLVELPPSPVATKDFPGGSGSKASVYNEADLGSIPGLGRFPWRRKWQSTPVLLPGKSHGQRSLVGYSPWGCKELDTTERLHFHFPVATKQVNQPSAPPSLMSARPGSSPLGGNEVVSIDVPLSLGRCR